MKVCFQWLAERDKYIFLHGAFGSDSNRFDIVIMLSGIKGDRAFLKCEAKWLRTSNGEERDV